MDIGTLAAFWAVSFLLVLVPGADWAYLIAAGLRDRSVLPAVAGLLAGYAVLTAVVAAGVATVIARSPLVLTVLTAFGAVYLLWLGVTTVTRPPAPTVATDRAERSWLRRAAKGAGVSGLNPKALLLFLAFLPQFLTHGAAWPFAAGTACRRHGGDPMLGSRDDRHRRPPARHAPVDGLTVSQRMPAMVVGGRQLWPKRPSSRWGPRRVAWTARAAR